MSNKAKPEIQIIFADVTCLAPDKVIAERLKTFSLPNMFEQLAYCRSLRIRNRILSLPLGATRDLLWTHPLKVSQQALSKRFPAETVA
jgi:hypothetical protein